MAGTRGDSMTHFMALLCLGLSVEAGTPEKAGIISKPTLWAEPAKIVAIGNSVTIWCEGTSVGQKYFLNSGTWNMQMPLESRNKAKHHIDHMAPDMARLYFCEQCGNSGYVSSSNFLDMMVTDLYSKPTLKALPSIVVASGGTVMLRCGSAQSFQGFILNWEGELSFQYSKLHPNGQFYALFPVGPMTPGHNWTFNCYGHLENSLLMSYSSEPLQLLVSGASGRPSLLNPQGPITIPGQNLTLLCRSEVDYDTFALSNEGDQDLLQRPSHHPQAGLSQADFSLSPVNISHMGRYRCYGGHDLNPLWSESSDPLDILIAGQLPNTPVLLVQPGPSVSPGDNVTLLCVSEGWVNTFLLVKEGVADSPLRVKVYKTEEITQAQFSFYPVTTAQSGTYRCYSSHSISPYRLSHPSAPLKLWVSGAGASVRPSLHALNYIRAVNLIRILLGGAVLLFLMILLLEARLSQSRNQW